MKNNKLKSPRIYIQAVIAMLIIQLVHKIVHEIPLAIEHKIMFGYFFIGLQTLLVLMAIILLSTIKKKWCIWIGFISACMLCIQPIISHVIVPLMKGGVLSDSNQIWWYPIFPIMQAIMIIYFSILVLHKEKTL